MSAATINPNEAAHFGALAADWWDPHGSSAMLHKLNPVRLAYIRDQIDAHWHVDARERHPLAGRSALDVGCGAGLLAEPLARMGAQVTGVDAAPENIAAARGHAAGQGLSITYFAGELADLPIPFVSSPSTARRAGAQDKLRPMAEVEIRLHSRSHRVSRLRSTRTGFRGQC